MAQAGTVTDFWPGLTRRFISQSVINTRFGKGFDALDNSGPRGFDAEAAPAGPRER